MNELLKIEYNPLGRILRLLVWLLLGLPFGLLFFFVVNNYFANIFGILMIVFSILVFLTCYALKI